ncbi:MAG: zf-HC2 domain-containing protein [Clostridia bacterium]|nr:zf-HC2 domain-containing protein [Clostridia bacterium]
MNNCTKYIEQMNMYLDGELKGANISELLEHIERCSNCKKRFESLKIISFQTREMDVNVPLDLHENIMRNVRTNARPAKKQINFRKLSKFASMAAAVMLIIAGIYVGLTTDFIFGAKSAEEADMMSPGANAKVASYNEQRSVPAAGIENSEAAEKTESVEAASEKAPMEFGFLKLYNGEGQLPDFVEDYAYKQDSESHLFYVYIENNAEVYSVFESQLGDAGFIGGEELNNTSNVNSEADYVLYIINLK